MQLDTHFVEAGKIGEVLISRPRVVRSTRSLIFITTEVTVDKRVHRDGERRVQDIEEFELIITPSPVIRERSGPSVSLRGWILFCFATLPNGRIEEKHMQYRHLGRSGLKVSPICLGTMMFGGPTDEATSIAHHRQGARGRASTSSTRRMPINGGSPRRSSAAPSPTTGTNWILADKTRQPASATIPTVAACRGAG